MSKGVKILLIVVAVVVILGAFLVGGLNQVVIKHESVAAAWAQVENQLQRRNDLIPNLVNTVQGYMTYEKELLTKITELRSQWGAAKTIDTKIEAAEGMSAALSRLLLVVEKYPDLKANQNFLALQAQLEGTENRIAVERMRYNNTVMDFNKFIRTIGGSIVATLRGLNKPQTYFEAEAAAREVPRVSFQ